MDFLQTLETIQAEEASVERLFGSEGRPARRRNATPEYQRQLAEATTFVAEVIQGKRRAWQLQEALSTSDFPILFGDILDRSILAAYTEWRASWSAIAKRRTVRDFRPAKMFLPMFGADTRLSEVPENTEYPETRIYEQDPLLFTVSKFGRRIPFTWEAIINDDLDMLRDIPERFGRAARRTEDYAATELYVGEDGPLTGAGNLYVGSAGNRIVTANGASQNNPPLTIAGLQDAMNVLSRHRDEVGEPILIEAVTLVIPPALEIVAQNILNATELRIDSAAAGGVPGQQLITANWMRNRLNVVVNPLLPIVDKSANRDSTWYLFANPNVGRPALLMGFLQGHETPEVFIKEPNQRRVGGGSAGPMDGDFETDSIQYKVRHVLGSMSIDPKMTAVSKGTGQAW